MSSRYHLPSSFFSHYSLPPSLSFSFFFEIFFLTLFFLTEWFILHHFSLYLSNLNVLSLVSFECFLVLFLKNHLLHPHSFLTFLCTSYFLFLASLHFYLHLLISKALTLSLILYTFSTLFHSPYDFLYYLLH